MDSTNTTFPIRFSILLVPDEYWQTFCSFASCCFTIFGGIYESLNRPCEVRMELAEKASWDLANIWFGKKKER
jgi:hypothetical protein